MATISLGNVRGPQGPQGQPHVFAIYQGTPRYGASGGYLLDPAATVFRIEDADGQLPGMDFSNVDAALPGKYFLFEIEFTTTAKTVSWPESWEWIYEPEVPPETTADEETQYATTYFIAGRHDASAGTTLFNCWRTTSTPV